MNGSGYSKLSAELELSRKGHKVTVVDALTFGKAASSRSGGGVSAGVNIGKGISGGTGQANRECGQDPSIESLLHERLAAYENVITLIEREGIECHFECRGRFVSAFTPSHFEDMKKKRRCSTSSCAIAARQYSISSVRRDRIATNYAFLQQPE
jgi:glycine/D-amino acid oxidase-like deaminating enzyme